MKIEQEFTVGLPVEEAWDVLLDLERIAPCMPGAQLQEVVDDEYRGIVKVKLGPITAQYKGAARFEHVDESVRSVVLLAEGRETKGQGQASARITAHLAQHADGTQVKIDTDLTISGRAAQFGRGVLADVSAKLMNEFAQRLEANIAGGNTPAAPEPAPSAMGGPATAGTATVRTISTPAAEPLDLMALSGSSVAKRVVPLVVAVLIALFLARRLR
jgi:carbon monoxide dehydrogenase subunit G